MNAGLKCATMAYVPIAIMAGLSLVMRVIIHLRRNRHRSHLCPRVPITRRTACSSWSTGACRGTSIE